MIQIIWLNQGQICRKVDPTKCIGKPCHYLFGDQDRVVRSTIDPLDGLQAETGLVLASPCEGQKDLLTANGETDRGK